MRPGEENIRRSVARYGENPFGKDIPEWELKKYTAAVMDVFEREGIIERMRQEKVRIVASSVSVGNRDTAVMRILNKRLGELDEFQRPEIIFTDYATRRTAKKEKENKPKSIMQWPKEPLENIDLKLIACNMFHIPLPNNSVDVLYERLGALWHAANADKLEGSGKGNQSYTKAVLKEYKRIIRPGGKLIFDLRTSRSNVPPTLTAVTRAIGKPGELAEAIFRELGFEFEVAPRRQRGTECFAILTLPT